MRFGLCQGFVKAELLVPHPSKNVVGGPVDDAEDGVQLIGNETFSERLDNRNAAGDRGFEVHIYPGTIGCRKQLVPMVRKERFVGRDDMLAPPNRLKEERPGRLEIGTPHLSTP